MRVLITGGAGFIGHHLIDYILTRTDWDIVTIDRLDLSGDLSRIGELKSVQNNKDRIKFIWYDLKSEINGFVAKEIGEIDYIVHLAASSHVDRSIDDPVPFILDNVLGTTNLLQFSKGLKNLKKFINFSTDEVFGPAPVGVNHKEDAPHYPSNPYSASKSGQGAIGYSFWVTHKIPVITTYTMNNFGERQFPEKLIPKTIRSIMEGTEMPIFAEKNKKGKFVSVGSRFWLHCQNTASAIMFLLENGVPGEAYNIIGFDELTNLEIAEKIAEIVGKPLKVKLVDFHKTRPGHDRRYALDGSKLLKMGWKPEVDFDKSLKKVVEFTMANQRWM